MCVKELILYSPITCDILVGLGHTATPRKAQDWTAMPEAFPKLKFPRLTKLALRRFSLFSANPDVEFQCNPGVLCLVGANGIGKSTLLTAINFCLTGIVSDPDRTFESIDEYYRFTKQYSTSYFRGRILGGDQNDADITLFFKLGEYSYEVRRGLFEPEELRSLVIRNGNSEDIVDDAENMSRRERHLTYAQRFVEHCGVSSFEEFVFLQHFVFTFDEQRRTLFWNSRIMERVLYRAFGMDPEMAKKADSLRRESQHEDSRVRNYQWEATRMRKRINEIRSQLQAQHGAQQRFDTLTLNHETITGQFEEDTKALKEVEDAIKDASLQLSHLSVRETALRDEYSRFFNESLSVRPPLDKHPLISQSIAECTCGLCGSKSEDALRIIAERSTGTHCPLCDSVLQQAGTPQPDTSQLQMIDRELAQTRKGIKDVQKTLEGLRVGESEARQRWEITKEKLDQFDRENTAALDSLRRLLTANTGDGTLGDYREQLAVLEREKKEAFEKREALKNRLQMLQRDLERQYIEVEENFVPRFAGLAQAFLGMPLSVQMDARASEEVKLVVTVRGTTRRQQQHLSESQRFFLDIALRMALTQHMSDPQSPGGMFIDTPEGSLDIAYEKRAGDMLAKFAASGHQIVMTANLNTSKLLLALATQCKSTGMQLCRMTDWAELSEVQQEEEGLFEEAYAAIQAAMNT